MDDRELRGRRRTDINQSDPPQDIRALVVDDDVNYAEYIAVVSRRLGLQMDIATDADSAVALLGNTAYDILIIDCQMPKTSGLDLIAAVRRRELVRDAYSVMLSALDDVTTKIAALTAGFDDFISKSSSEPEIVAKIAAARRMVARNRNTAAEVQALWGMATRDELTGVFNRRFFVEATTRMLGEGQTVSIVLFDLDEFKRINDTYGHLAGDLILREVGALFQRSTRQEDFVARYGGDEFVMVCAGLTAAEAETVAIRLEREIQELQWSAGGSDIAIGVTSGIAGATAARATLGELLDAADRDLYRKKRRRKHPAAPAAVPVPSPAC